MEKPIYSRSFHRKKSPFWLETLSIGESNYRRSVVCESFVFFKRFIGENIFYNTRHPFCCWREIFMKEWSLVYILFSWQMVLTGLGAIQARSFYPDALLQRQEQGTKWTGERMFKFRKVGKISKNLHFCKKRISSDVLLKCDRSLSWILTTFREHTLL